MSKGGTTGYASINARVRVMYSTLLTPQEVSRLVEAPDLNTLLTLLKPTAYGPYLEKVKDKDLSPRRAAFQIRGRLADTYTSIIHGVPEHASALLAQRFRYFEVENLKAVLRGIVNGSPWDTVRFVLFPYGSETRIPAQEMVESGSVTAAVELLRGTPYYDTLSYAVKRYSAEQNIFPLEVAVDLNYWRELWKDVRQLPDQDRVQALKIVGELVDMNNLMWAIRYRVYYQLSEEELINYTLPFGYRVRDEDIRGVAAGADFVQIVKKVYPDLKDVEGTLLEPRSGLPKLELELQQRVVERCRAAFLGSPFHIGLPLAYLTLSEIEIQDLVVLIEAKAAGVPVERYRQYLAMGASAQA
jgi:V/A-type H+-transporting ATPase subunit C